MDQHLEIYFTIILIVILILEQDRLSIDLRKCTRKTRAALEYCRLRVQSDDVNAILSMDNKKTQEHLRITSHSFRKILELMPHKSHGWKTEYELMVFLYWMAAGCSYRVAGGFIGISRYTVKSIIHKMLDYFAQDMRHLIKPPSYDERSEIGLKFCRRAKSQIFRNAIGAIDGCHIRIKCPENKHDEYLNYKCFYSIQLQAVVDSNYLFNDVFVGFPGSVHDTRVFKNSPLYEMANYTDNQSYLLGDSGYPCQLQPVAVITPYKNAVGQQKKFNTAHSRARNIVECAFGILKMRWRNIFNRSLEIKIENSIKTVFAACVLHNICVTGGDIGPTTAIDVIMNQINVQTDERNSSYERVSIEAINFRNTLLEQLV